jgi:hypothetical protein
MLIFFWYFTSHFSKEVDLTENTKISGEASGSLINLFQIIAPDLKPIKINIVNELSITTRNDNCFGSTN